MVQLKFNSTGATRTSQNTHGRTNPSFPVLGICPAQIQNWFVSSSTEVFIEIRHLILMILYNPDSKLIYTEGIYGK